MENQNNAPKEPQDSVRKKIIISNLKLKIIQKKKSLKIVFLPYKIQKKMTIIK